LSINRNVVRRVKYQAIWAIADIIILLLAYQIAYVVTFIDTSPAGTIERLDLRSMGIAIPITLLVLYLAGVYHHIWSKTSGHNVGIIVNAVLVTTLLLLVLGTVLAPDALPARVVLKANFLALVGLVATRYRSRLITGLVWRWHAVWNLRFPTIPERVLIVGAAEPGQVIAERLRYHTTGDGRVYDVIGFIDEDRSVQGLYVEGIKILGCWSDIPELADAHRVDLIVLAVDGIPDTQFRELLKYCESTAARIKIAPDTFAVLHNCRNTPVLRDVQPEDLLGRNPITRHAAVDFEAVTGKTVLVTGAAGSIGSELCRQMLNYCPSTLLVLDNNESALHDLVLKLNDGQPHEELIAVLADITDSLALRRVFEQHKPEVVFHSAAYKHVPLLEQHLYESLRVNVGGSLLLAQLAYEHGVERFVLISTDKAVNFSSIMGASKRICELITFAFSQLQGCRTRFAAVRFGNVLGSRGSVVPLFNRQIDAGGPVTVTDPRMTRYFMTIPEAVNLVIHASCLTTGGDLFMLRMGEAVRIVELAERMIRLRGLRPCEDVPLKYIGIRSGEKLSEELHSEFETPLETVHPDIVQLESCLEGFDGGNFLARVEALLAQSFACTGDQLFTLARTPCNSSPTVAHVSGWSQPSSAHPGMRLSGRNGENKMNIPMSSPDITQSELDAVTEVLHTQWLSCGPKVQQFEAAFAAYLGMKHGIAVNSGTSGLHMAMIAADIGPGDEVITPSFSFVASANCILYQGATPVFVDIDPMTKNLDPGVLESAITERTKAIIAVHAFGQPADMDPIVEVAQKYSLTLIEDACEAIGARYKGRLAGTFGEAAVFAFYPNKQMTTGEGGMIVTNNDEWAELFASVRNQGRDTFNMWLEHSRLGYNYRLDEMSAALGLAQLQRIEELLQKRARVAAWYDERIDRIPGVERPYVAPTTTRMSWFIYPVTCSEQVNRNALMRELQAVKVPSRPYFAPIHLQSFYQARFGGRMSSLPHTERAGDSVVALPFSGIMTEEEVDYVCRQLQAAVERVREQSLSPVATQVP
jgi:perosamine synthetase